MHTVFGFTSTLPRIPLYSALGHFKVAFWTGFPVSMDSEYRSMVQGGDGDGFQERVCPHLPGSGSASLL